MDAGLRGRAPEPEDADPRLDFSGGALLVPVERWNEHAALEPNLAPCRVAASFAAAMDTPPTGSVSAVAPSSGDEDERLTSGVSVARIVTRAATTALAFSSLARSFIAARSSSVNPSDARFLSAIEGS